MLQCGARRDPPTGRCLRDSIPLTALPGLGSSVFGPVPSNEEIAVPFDGHGGYSDPTYVKGALEAQRAAAVRLISRLRKLGLLQADATLKSAAASGTLFGTLRNRRWERALHRDGKRFARRSLGGAGSAGPTRASTARPSGRSPRSPPRRSLTSCRSPSSPSATTVRQVGGAPRRLRRGGAPTTARSAGADRPGGRRPVGRTDRPDPRLRDVAAAARPPAATPRWLPHRRRGEAAHTQRGCRGSRRHR